MAEYDFIVIGPGSVGCVVAARLCANPAARVLLLEAGGAQQTVAMEVPSAWAELLGNEAEWGYVTSIQAWCRGHHLPGRQGLGGPGAINAMAEARRDLSRSTRTPRP